ncbi:MAG: hypothetical protein ACXACR_16740, partial [Candidatus Hodarchaeales archaeon]
QELLSRFTTASLFRMIQDNFELGAELCSLPRYIEYRNYYIFGSTVSSHGVTMQKKKFNQKKMDSRRFEHEFDFFSSSDRFTKITRRIVKTLEDFVK